MNATSSPNKTASELERRAIANAQLQNRERTPQHKPTSGGTPNSTGSIASVGLEDVTISGNWRALFHEENFQFTDPSGNRGSLNPEEIQAFVDKVSPIKENEALKRAAQAAQDLDQASDTFIEKYNSEMKKLRALLEANISAQETTLEQLQSAQSLLQEKTEQEKNHLNEIQEKLDAIATLEDTVSTHESKIGELESLTEEQKNEKERLDEELKRLSDQLQALEEEKEKLVSDSSTQSEALDEANRKIREKKILLVQASKAKQQFEKEISLLASQHNALITSLKEQIQALETTLVDVRSDKGQLQGQVAELTEKVRIKDEEIQQNIAQNEALKESMIATTRKLQGLNYGDSTDLASRLDESVALRENLYRQQVEITSAPAPTRARTMHEGDNEESSGTHRAEEKNSESDTESTVSNVDASKQAQEQRNRTSEIISTPVHQRTLASGRGGRGRGGRSVLGGRGSLQGGKINK